MLELIKINADTREIELNYSSYILLDPIVQEAMRQVNNKRWEGDYDGMKRYKMYAFFTYCTYMMSPKSPYATLEEDKKDNNSRAVYGSIGDWDFRAEKAFSEAYDRMQELWNLREEYRSWKIAQNMYEATVKKIEEDLEANLIDPLETERYMQLLDTLPERLNKLRNKAISSLDSDTNVGSRKVSARENPDYINKFSSNIPSLSLDSTKKLSNKKLLNGNKQKTRKTSTED